MIGMRHMKNYFIGGIAVLALFTGFLAPTQEVRALTQDELNIQIDALKQEIIASLMAQIAELQAQITAILSAQMNQAAQIAQITQFVPPVVTPEPNVQHPPVVVIPADPVEPASCTLRVTKGPQTAGEHTKYVFTWEVKGIDPNTSGGLYQGLDFGIGNGQTEFRYIPVESGGLSSEPPIYTRVRTLDGSVVNGHAKKFKAVFNTQEFNAGNGKSIVCFADPR
jgi:hypothetical protein